MPRACAVEGSRWLLRFAPSHSSERESPRDKPVASFVARWLGYSSERESPRRKAVASKSYIKRYIKAAAACRPNAARARRLA